MSFILKDGQQVGLELQITDAEGNDVASTSMTNIGWESSDPNLILVLLVPDDQRKATARTVPGPGVGTATVTVRARADLGEGEQEVTGTLDLDVVAGDAAIVNIQAGTPEDRTPAEPA